MRRRSPRSRSSRLPPPPSQPVRCPRRPADALRRRRRIHPVRQPEPGKITLPPGSTSGSPSATPAPSPPAGAAPTSPTRPSPAPTSASTPCGTPATAAEIARSTDRGRPGPRHGSGRLPDRRAVARARSDDGVALPRRPGNPAPGRPASPRTRNGSPPPATSTTRTDERRSDELGRLATAFNTMLDALRGLAQRAATTRRRRLARAAHPARRPPAPTSNRSSSTPSSRRRPTPRLLGDAIAELREMTDTDRRAGRARPRRRPAASTSEPVRLDQLTENIVASRGTPLRPRHSRRARADLVERRTRRPRSRDRQPARQRRQMEPARRPGRRHRPSTAPSPSATTAPASTPPTCPTSSTASTAPPERRTLPGSGLGLAIVRQVTEAHGGSVDVETAPGGGAVFTLRLPIVVSSQNGRHLSRGTSCSL